MRTYSIFNLSKNRLDKFLSWIRIARNFTLIPLIAISLAFVVGCDDDDDDFSSSGNTLSISDIQGFWNAESATFSGPEFIDLYEEPGSITLSIQSNGQFTFMIKRPGEPDEVYTGKLGFDGDFLAVRFDREDEDDSFFISLINDILTLRGQTELDLDGDGNFDLGILELIMERD